MRITGLITLLVSLLATPLLAQDTRLLAQDTSDVLGASKWLERPLVIFADSPFDPRFVRQMEMLDEDPQALLDRDVVVLTDTDPAANGPLRQELRPNDFMLVLIDKEGNIVLRKPTPWTVREISHAIDKLPMRRDELAR